MNADPRHEVWTSLQEDNVVEKATYGNPLYDLTTQQVEDELEAEEQRLWHSRGGLKERLNSLIVEYGPATMTLSAADKLAGDLVTIILEGRRP